MNDPSEELAGLTILGESKGATSNAKILILLDQPTWLWLFVPTVAGFEWQQEIALIQSRFLEKFGLVDRLKSKLWVF